MTKTPGSGFLIPGRGLFFKKTAPVRGWRMRAAYTARSGEHGDGDSISQWSDSVQ